MTMLVSDHITGLIFFVFVDYYIKLILKKILHQILILFFSRKKFLYYSNEGKLQKHELVHNNIYSQDE